MILLNLGNVVILGDSYSTFSEFVPLGNDCWYFPEKSTVETDVLNVEKTWWKLLLNDVEAELILNESFSGTTVCHTGYNAADCKEFSFVGRFMKLVNSNFFTNNKINTLFIFGGTNDSWANSPIGELELEDIKPQDLYSVLPAFSFLIKTAKELLPNTRIINITNCDLKYEITAGFDIICKKYGVENIELANIEKCYSHPNSVGMQQIKQQVLNALLSHLN